MRTPCAARQRFCVFPFFAFQLQLSLSLLLFVTCTADDVVVSMLVYRDILCLNLGAGDPWAPKNHQHVFGTMGWFDLGIKYMIDVSFRLALMVYLR